MTTRYAVGAALFLALVLWGYAEWWKDRALDLERERDEWRRRASPGHDTVVTDTGEVVADVPRHRCDPPNMPRGSSWTCPVCSITWGAPLVDGITRSWRR